MNLKKLALTVTALFMTTVYMHAQSALISGDNGELDLNDFIEKYNGTAGTSVSLFDKTQVADGLNSFASCIVAAAPQVATQQNVWADAYIGKLFPSLVPHFGFGASAGATQLNMKGFKQASEALKDGISTVGLTGKIDLGKIPDNFLLPTISADFRLGGIILPVDIGFNFMVTDSNLSSLDPSKPETLTTTNKGLTYNAFGADFSLSYTTFGFDIRYSLIKGNFFVPKVSLGAGYIYTNGQFAVASERKSTQAHMALAYNSQVMFLQAQISKNILFLNVFGGIRGNVSSTTATWAWDYKSKFSKNIDGTAYSAVIKDQDKGTVNKDGISADYKKTGFDFSAMQPQVYAGFALNLLIFQTSFSACADLRSFINPDKYPDKLWSGALSFHVKI